RMARLDEVGHGRLLSHLVEQRHIVSANKGAALPLLPNPFTVPGEWFRGNLHAHTTNSDGGMPPHKLVGHYAHAGWDFLALTDHWRVSELPPPDAYTQDITVIPGIEVNTANASTEAGTTYHVVGLNVHEPPPRNDDLSGPRAAQWY